MFFFGYRLVIHSKISHYYLMKLVRKRDAAGLISFVVVMFAAVLLFYHNSLQMGYKWQWYRVPQYLFTRDRTGVLKPGPIIKGLGTTLLISGISLLFTVVIGLLAAVLRLSSSYAGRIISRVYLDLIRNTPLLIQILFTYFVIAPIFGMSPFVSAVISLSLFEGAYTSEIIRGGIMSIHRGQWESAYSLGFSSLDTLRFVIIPQTFRQVLPPLASQSVSLIKDSALVSTIAIFDLTMAGQAVVSKTFLTFEIWFTVALVYLAVTVPVSAAVHLIEKRITREK